MNSVNGTHSLSFHSLLKASALGVMFAALLFIQQEAPLSVFVADADDKDYQYIGTSQCSAPSCHGGDTPKAKRSSTEYTTWSKKDPHSKGFDKLVSEEAADFVETYNEDADKPIQDAAKDPRCLRCHTVGNIEKSRRGSKFNLEDGVSCERCHGPASGFINIHNKDNSSYEKSKRFGMWDTRSIVKRADICISCHLTADSGFVDAGHPDLGFELYSYLMRQNPHWYERQSWDGVRLWLVGQGASLRFQLKKLEGLLAQKVDDDGLEDQRNLVLTYMVVFRHGVEVFGSAELKKPFQDLWLAVKKESLERKKVSGQLAPLRALLKKAELAWAAQKDFKRAELRGAWDRILGDKANLQEADEYQAEQFSGALLALYNSLKYGAGPRMAKPILVPKPLGKIMVKAWSCEPDFLFDDDENFKSAKYAKYVAALKKQIKLKN